VYNRPHWFTHALRNIETSSYPRDKIVWVIVDDSDTNERVDSYIEKTRQALPDLNIVYVSLPKKTPIGNKRNIGCEAAIKSNNNVSVLAFMDDDDHYPTDSLNIRINSLSDKIGAVYCATLPMYDTCKYISAMNVPPLDLGPSERVSEATLCFTRDFWEQCKFPKDTNIGEGEGFLVGRENETTEISPKGVIVSFIHNKNLTSRRVPEQKESNGCHYGFSDEYFTMISQIAGTT
jgi:glycosyltransferase involved in cell wall biosynthesis